MHKIYVGDSIDISSRINKRHCSGNVKTSVFREHIAERLKFPIKREPRLSRYGNLYTDVYIDLPDRRNAEKQISAYVAEGRWKFVECSSKDEARDFQYYAIKKIEPIFNVKRPTWDVSKEKRYVELFKQLMDCPWHTKSDKNFPDTPGVYFYGNTRLP